MATEKRVEKPTLGRGDLYFAVRAGDGTLGGYRYIGNTPDFGLQITTEYLKHYNSSRGVRVQDKETPVQVDREGSFSTDNITHPNLAILFQGSTETIAQASVSNASETLNNVEVGLTYQIGATVATPEGVRNVTIVSVMVGAVAKVAGTDYDLDAARGLITIRTDGSIVNGNNVVVTYNIAAHSREQTVTGANSVAGALMFAAFNPEGDDIDYRMLDVKLSPNGEFAIKADEWQKLPFKVSINEPTSGAAAILADGQPYAP